MPARPPHLASILLGGGLLGTIAAAAAVVLAYGAPGSAAALAPGDRPVPGPAATSLEAVDRAIVLLDEAWIRWTGGAELDEVADWLEGQPDVEWAESMNGTLRFQASGAMPLGLVSGERIAAPRVEMLPGAALDTIPPAGSLQRTRLARGGGGQTRGAPRLSPVVADPGWGWGGPSADDWAPAEPVNVARFSDDHVISDNSDFTTNRPKRALVLGLFDWEFGPLETFEVGASIRRGREFKCDSCVDVRVTDFKRAVRTLPGCEAEPDGHCLPVQQTSWRDFLGWGTFDLIHVGTHGWQECRPDGSCYTAIATGRIGSRRKPIDGITPRIGQELLRRDRYELIRTEWNVVPEGVEYHVVGSSEVCRGLGDGAPSQRVQRLGGGGDPFDYRVTDRETEAWDLLCRDGMLLETVTDRFFYLHYPNGLPDKLVVFSACEVFKDPGLATHLAGRERSSIFGWTVPVDNTIGRNVMRHFYGRLFPGAWAGGDAVADRGGGARAVVACADAVARHYEPISTEGGDRARSPSRFPAPDSSDFVDKRPVELPYLVDRQTNAEVQDGARLELVGIPGDGRPDSLDIMVEVHGLAEETELDRFAVGFRVDGVLLPETHPLTRPLGDEAWVFEGRVPLGRDARLGERVDLDVRVEIPRGGISRWLYRDLLLTANCSFTGRITEIGIPAPRQRFQAMLGEYAGRAVVDRDGFLTFRIENRGNPARDFGTPEVTFFEFTLHPDAVAGRTGPAPVAAGRLLLTRDNPFHNPRQTWNSTEVLETEFHAGLQRPREPGAFLLDVFTTERMAGSVSVPLERAGAKVRFEADFDAGLARSCG